VFVFGNGVCAACVGGGNIGAGVGIGAGGCVYIVVDAYVGDGVCLRVCWCW